MACGLDDALATLFDATVFAPTDKAFADAGIDVATAKCDGSFQLFLTGMSAQSVLRASDMLALTTFGGSIDNSNGRAIPVKLDPQRGLVLDDGSANPPAIVIKNMQASNGVLHGIDGVLKLK